jgi:hypothetical protein
VCAVDLAAECVMIFLGRFDQMAAKLVATLGHFSRDGLPLCGTPPGPPSLDNTNPRHGAGEDRPGGVAGLTSDCNIRAPSAGKRRWAAARSDCTDLLVTDSNVAPIPRVDRSRGMLNSGLVFHDAASSYAPAEQQAR